jgi:KDO2-lipid IV(A) lauroyltransferase
MCEVWLRMGAYLTRTLVKIFFNLVALFPLSWARSVGKCIAWFHYISESRTFLIVRANVQLCFENFSEKEKMQLVKDSLSHTAQTMMEAPAVWLADIKRTNNWILAVENEQLLDGALSAGNGVIVLLPHQGNWEMYNVYTAARNRPMTALYKPPDLDFLKPLMLEVRMKYGNELVPTNIKGISTLYKRLKSGRQVTILPDQVPATGRFAPFFGELALTDILISRLLKKTGATVICCVVVRQDRGFTVRFSEVDKNIYAEDIDKSLVAMNKTIEASVMSELDQYQWPYKRYKERPPGLPKIYSFLDKKIHP